MEKQCAKNYISLELNAAEKREPRGLRKILDVAIIAAFLAFLSDFEIASFFLVVNHTTFEWFD